MIKSNKISNLVAILSIISTLLVSGSVWGQSKNPRFYSVDIQQQFSPQTDNGNLNINPRLAILRSTDIVGNFDYPPITPIASFAFEPNVVIVSVRSVRPTFGSDEDLIYLRVVNGKGDLTKKSRKRRMKAGDIWDPKFGARILKSGSVSLMESDSFSSDDRIGGFRYHQGRSAGRYVETMKGDGGEYEVIIEVRAVSGPTREDVAEHKKILQKELAWEKNRWLTGKINLYNASKNSLQKIQVPM